MSYFVKVIGGIVVVRMNECQRFLLSQNKFKGTLWLSYEGVVISLFLYIDGSQVPNKHTYKNVLHHME
jgi:uncharacterized membrane protein